MSFNDKVVLVTGASSGIGAAIAIRFAAEGAKVAIVGRNESKLQSVAASCAEKGPQPLEIIADVTNDNDVKRIVSSTVNHFGKLDVLINNAGVAGSISILNENALNLFDHIISTNLRSVVHVTNLAAPHLVNTKGNIVNISSIASLKPLTPENFAYCTSKAGLDHFTRCVALELSAKGVRVNSVNPGPVATDIVSNLRVGEDYEKMIWQKMKDSTLLDRISEADEIADLVLFLAGESARGITGSTYVTDNGALLKN